jgi:eukaryotic-like serine/threonine-protein kinase
MKVLTCYEIKYVNIFLAKKNKKSINLNKMISNNIDDYKLLCEIGQGSTSRVYLAEKNNQKYAIKIFDNNNLNDFFHLHVHEYTILKNLDHDSIVKVFDFGTTNNQSFLVMSYIQGSNLENLVQSRGSLTIKEVVKIIKHISSGIDYARQMNVIHGDIKPSNILIDLNGNAQLADFGLAKITPSKDDMKTMAVYKPKDQPVLGTADFMAPEVLNDGPMTWASDIYSLGLVAYYALSGRYPSDGKTIFTRGRDRTEGKIIALSQRNPLINQSLDFAVQKALAVDPKSRYTSAESFYASLITSESPTIPDDLSKNSITKNDNNSKMSKIDIYRYIVIPIAVAIIGGLVALAKVI